MFFSAFKIFQVKSSILHEEIRFPLTPFSKSLSIFLPSLLPSFSLKTSFHQNPVLSFAFFRVHHSGCYPPSKSIPDKNLSLDRQSLEQQTFKQINVYLSKGLRVSVEGTDLGQQYIRYADYIYLHANKFSFNSCTHEFYERMNSNKNSVLKPLSSEDR